MFPVVVWCQTISSSQIATARGISKIAFAPTSLNSTLIKSSCHLLLASLMSMLTLPLGCIFVAANNTKKDIRGHLLV
uniref:Uncharacterized protein n=1 Tax=Gossypium raimondii TaxID=29730 RepID=A0A0D2T6X8_GOSRA|nr:hypothetical protein B456_007G019600 [Gossypium raimondii]